ncbi:hypothetical protein Pmar_PMAR019193 [Perkinsus marinus ATCC 50983]|uniref:Uncharacterized protein n=1 Tax=Perkinsus marinus (strain ATCC 50983 / TXsc) TaxID=423536 RepID=C5KU45_PERM5|nr:hypothetical protein Pmar_PMAR019193 [Perkinsus marinus ATCC 50983]EER12087.1 hypothetical protein Pmar_PMAR019193 [Perkinsus marinus ATCC 50983]|eukprot:XP_002780292.1 hypothetical protein Pmar_PMAR019193 [Perkinsus marinus ATCC 50983]
MGESKGVRYYFDPWPKGMGLSVSELDSREVNGFSCHHTRPSLVPFKYSQSGSAWLYTVSDIRGFREYHTSGNIARETCFETFTHAERGKQRAKILSLEHPVVTTANQLCAGGELVLSMAEEEPAPNGVYYGFTEDGLEVTIKFDGRSRIKEVRMNGPKRERYTELIFSMIGKAISCVFGIQGEDGVTDLIVEPVDPTKFNGTKESFQSARLNTMVGQPFDPSNLRRLFGLSEPGKLKRLRSRIARSIRSIRIPAFSMHRRMMRDGMDEKLLAEDEIDSELSRNTTQMIAD